MFDLDDLPHVTLCSTLPADSCKTLGRLLHQMNDQASTQGQIHQLSSTILLDSFAIFDLWFTESEDGITRRSNIGKTHLEITTEAQNNATNVFSDSMRPMKGCQRKSQKGLSFNVDG